MYWKICIVGIFQVYKINLKKKKGPIPVLSKALFSTVHVMCDECLT